MDPVDQISISNYAVFRNNPVFYIDPDGQYSRVGAWWRNIAWGGDGISKRGEEWGVDLSGKGIDGVTEFVHKTKGEKYKFFEDYRQQWLKDYENDQFVSNFYHLSTGKNLGADVAEGMVSDEPMDTKDRINALFNMSSPAFFGVAPQSFATAVAAKTGLQLQKSVTSVMGKGYKAAGEVTVPIKNTELLNTLNATSKGNWVKVYEAGIQNGSKIETHYFRNNTTRQVFDVKTKYNYWHQKAFKNLGQ